MKKLPLKFHVIIFRGFYVVAALLAIYAYLNRIGTKPHFTIWIALALLIGGVAWRAIFVQCPHCGDGLTQSRKLPKECPKCGKPLNEPPTEGE